MQIGVLHCKTYCKSFPVEPFPALLLAVSLGLSFPSYSAGLLLALAFSCLHLVPQLTRLALPCLFSGLNAGAPPPEPQQRVRFLLGPLEGSEEKELTLTATSVPSLTTHPLGKAYLRGKAGRPEHLSVWPQTNPPKAVTQGWEE